MRRGAARMTIVFKASLFLAPMLLFLAACTIPSAPVAPEGRLDVLVPTPALSPSTPGGWIVAGFRKTTTRHSDEPTWTFAPVQGVPAIEVRCGRAPAFMVRRIRALLLATPFLSWSWNLGPSRSRLSPFRIVVGFNGGAPEHQGGWRAALLRTLATKLPEHDREMVFVWGRSALQRGKLVMPPANGHPSSAPYYIVRGGRENTGQWWVETVDLSALYAHAWPDDAIATSRIAFIGIALSKCSPPSEGYFSGIRLSH